MTSRMILCTGFALGTFLLLPAPDCAHGQQLVQAKQGKQVNVRKAETYIPDLMQIDWIKLENDRTVVQFQFLRKFCGAAAQAPGHANAFRIVDARKSEGPSFTVQSTEGILKTFGERQCGTKGDTFRLTFPALPREVTHINVLEGAGGRQGLWSWYNIRIR